MQKITVICTKNEANNLEAVLSEHDYKFSSEAVAQNSTDDNSESRAIALVNKIDAFCKEDTCNGKFVRQVVGALSEYRSAKADISS